MRILIGVTTALKYWRRRNAIAGTWGTVADQLGVPWYFIIGDPQLVSSQEKPQQHRLVVPCPDTYIYLPAKIREFCRWALTRSDWDYLFKVDDDTYVDVAKLIEEQWHGDFIGCGHRTYRRRISGGPGYLLSRAAVEVLVRQVVEDQGAEDLIVFDALMSRQIRPTKDDRFQRVYRGTAPTPTNHLITTHNCDPDLMRRIHNGYRPNEKTPAISYHGAQ